MRPCSGGKTRAEHEEREEQRERHAGAGEPRERATRQRGPKQPQLTGNRTLAVPGSCRCILGLGRRRRNGERRRQRGGTGRGRHGRGRHGRGR